MELLNALTTRRTVHSYEQRPVPSEIVDSALEAARWAPNHKLTNPWRFYLLGPEHQAKVAQLARSIAENEARAKGFEETRVRAAGETAAKKIVDSPILIVVSYRRSPDDPFRDREDYAATACAIQNIQLAFWGHGVGAKWSTGAVTRAEGLYTLLGIEREAEETIGFVKAGYPAVVPAVKRTPLTEVLRRLP